MAAIRNIRLSAKKETGTGNRWQITVNYDAHFSQHEVDTYEFRDGFVLKEDDSGSWFGGSDDRLTGVVAVSRFNPNARVVPRTLTHTISGDTLDTELGEEELYVVVRLRNLDLNWLYTERSSKLYLSP